MKVSAKGASKYLAKEDLDVPRVVLIDSLWMERLKSNRGEEDKYILSFSDRNLKPMVLNVLNRKVLISTYGDESDDWRGRPIELYVDPNVAMGGEIVGGIRVRIPQQGVPATNFPVRPATPAQPAANGRAPVVNGRPAAAPQSAANGRAPVVNNRPAAPLQDLAAKHAQVLHGLTQAPGLAEVLAWKAWANKVAFTEEQFAEQDQAREDRLTELGIEPPY